MTVLRALSSTSKVRTLQTVTGLQQGRRPGVLIDNQLGRADGLTLPR